MTDIEQNTRVLTTEVLQEARDAFSSALNDIGSPLSAKNALKGWFDDTPEMQAIIAKTREVHELRAKLGEKQWMT